MLRLLPNQTVILGSMIKYIQNIIEEIDNVKRGAL